MDYEKLYKEALQRAKDFENGEVHYAINKGYNIMHWIFPELAESEDERIRKALLSEFIHLQSKGYKFAGLEGEEIIAWLEKQNKQILANSAKTCKDEQKPTDSYCQENCKGYQETGRCFVDGECEAKKSQRMISAEAKEALYDKPAWSEEDNKMVDSIIEDVRYIGDFPDHPTKEENELYAECLAKAEWLKSLKDRVQLQNTWKPSDEQMNTLSDAIVYIEGCNSNFKGSGSVLEKLYCDLKKLKE